MATKTVLSANNPDNKNQIIVIDESHLLKFKEKIHKDINPVSFGENIILSGLEGKKVIPFDRLNFGDAVLEVTKVKDIIYFDPLNQENIVLTNASLFCREIKPGTIKIGDDVNYIPKIYKGLIITLSDRASRGEYEDRSGPVIRETLSDFFETKKLPYDLHTEIIPDNADDLKKLVLKAAEDKYDVIITTGGTGIGKKDITVDTIQPMLDKEIPGIMEHIRLKYGSEKPNALLSRGVAGVIDNSLIYTLPGSVKAVNEYMSEIEKTIYHLFFMLHGIDSH